MKLLEVIEEFQELRVEGKNGLQVSFLSKIQSFEFGSAILGRLGH